MSVQIVNEVDRVDDAENNALADYHSVNVFMLWAFLIVIAVKLVSGPMLLRVLRASGTS
jgi:hypothetical protein